MSLLACPSCGGLVHGETLRALAREAEGAQSAGDTETAVSRWRRALELLPRESRQHQQVAARIEALTAAPSPARGATAGDSSGKSKRAAQAAGIGALALLVWKAKPILLFVFGKAKFVLLGFTKLGTLFSMLASLALYTTVWGWKFALGFILSMYIHEMGHVAALKRLGIAATAPMFIPGLGALVRMKQYPATAREDAWVGLAGPLWGLGASLALWFLGSAFDSPLFLAVARAGAWLNLFNLLPLGPLDGGRGFRALSRGQRWVVCGALGAALFTSGEGLLALLLVASIVRCFMRDAPEAPDHRTLALFVSLVVGLSMLSVLDVPLDAPDGARAEGLSSP